jgi:hypothetical protein
MSAAIVSCYHFIAIALIIVLRLASDTPEFQLQSGPHGAWNAAWQAALLLCGLLTRGCFALATTVVAAHNCPAALTAFDDSTHHLKVIFIVFNMRVIHMLCSTRNTRSDMLSHLAEVLLLKFACARGLPLHQNLPGLEKDMPPALPISVCHERPGAMATGCNKVEEHGQLANKKTNLLCDSYVICRYEPRCAASLHFHEP